MVGDQPLHGVTQQPLLPGQFKIHCPIPLNRLSDAEMQEQRRYPSVLRNRLGPSQFQAGARFSKPLYDEATVADDFDPSAQCPMETRRPERRDPFAFLLRHGLEPPSLHLPVYRIKMTRNLNRPRRAIGVS